MRDSDCVAFLHWALPRMGYRWPGFRRVRRQVCKRIGRRLQHLRLPDLQAYREILERTPDEWTRLDDCCRITISRFFRDRCVFQALGEQILPRIGRTLEARTETRLRAWSAGCGAGEEPYSLAILHRHAHHPAVRATDLEIIATDSDAHQLERARRAVYPASCLRDVPADLRAAAFDRLAGHELQLKPAYRTGIDFCCQDLRRAMPAGLFHLILCRNLAFTYFVDELQRAVLRGLLQRLAAGGFLVVGGHEDLPEGGVGLVEWSGGRGVFSRPAFPTDG